MKKVLFVCIHNSARSQMAEGFLNALGHGHFVAESAGIEKGVLNPLVVKAMMETGIDISMHQTKEAATLIEHGKTYDAVVTVCDEASAEKCPVFPGKSKRIAWYFNDPSQFTGTEEEKLQQIRPIRDEIKASVERFIKEAGDPAFWNAN